MVNIKNINDTIFIMWSYYCASYLWPKLNRYESVTTSKKPEELREVIYSHEYKAG